MRSILFLTDHQDLIVQLASIVFLGAQFLNSIGREHAGVIKDSAGFLGYTKAIRGAFTYEGHV